LPPEFTKKIEPLTVTAGEEKAFFEIELSKGDAITKWFKNGKEVELSDRVHVKIDGKKQRLEVFILGHIVKFVTLFRHLIVNLSQAKKVSRRI